MMDRSLGETLNIKLSDTHSQPLVADKATIQCFSSCAKGLPATAQEWDISGLLVEGQHVLRSTVVAWLNVIYNLVHFEDFEQQQPSILKSMTGAIAVLAFADAVGSSLGMLRALSDAYGIPWVLEAEVHLEQQAVTVCVGSWREIQWIHRFQGLELWCYQRWTSPASRRESRLVATASSEHDKAAFLRQLAEQIEALLYYVYKLRLSLEHPIHTFLHENSTNLDAEYGRSRCIDDYGLTGSLLLGDPEAAIIMSSRVHTAKKALYRGPPANASRVANAE